MIRAWFVATIACQRARPGSHELACYAIIRMHSSGLLLTMMPCVAQRRSLTILAWLKQSYNYGWGRAGLEWSTHGTGVGRRAVGGWRLAVGGLTGGLFWAAKPVDVDFESWPVRMWLRRVMQAQARQQQQQQSQQQVRRKALTSLPR